MKYVPPSIERTSFNCPHCGALAIQFWFEFLAKQNPRSNPLPTDARKIDASKLEDEKIKENLTAFVEKMMQGAPFLEKVPSSRGADRIIHNLNGSLCYNCNELSVWIFNRLVFPRVGEAPPANPDMPRAVRQDYDEASVILNQSPRGAAALIRLAIQKLCAELGEEGKNINQDIGKLVKKGLDPRVQRALDSVRVIGNDAVHPGQIDLRDDRATAESLFRLLNLIVEKMISEPKHVDEVYESLPQSALDAIARRDNKGG